MKKLFVAVLLIVMVALLLSQVSKYQVMAKQCIGCGLCVDSKICPTNAISMKNGKAIIDVDKCIACGLCKSGNQNNYKGCPVNAINADIVKAKSSQTAISEKTPEVKNDKIKSVTKTNSETKVTKAKTDSIKVEDKKAESEENIIKKVIYYVDSKTCISCRLCVSQCPTNAISMQNGKAVIDMEKCISCGLCKNGNPSKDYRGCPVSAIKTK